MNTKRPKLLALILALFAIVASVVVMAAPNTAYLSSHSLTRFQSDHRFPHILLISCTPEAKAVCERKRKDCDVYWPYEEFICSGVFNNCIKECGGLEGSYFSSAGLGL